MKIAAQGPLTQSKKNKCDFIAAVPSLTVEDILGQYRG